MLSISKGPQTQTSKPLMKPESAYTIVSLIRWTCDIGCIKILERNGPCFFELHAKLSVHLKGERKEEQKKTRQDGNLKLPLDFHKPDTSTQFSDNFWIYGYSIQHFCQKWNSLSPLRSSNEIAMKCHLLVSMATEKSYIK